MSVIGPYDPESRIGVVFGRTHIEIGSVVDAEANKLPDLENMADSILDVCNVMLVCESKSVIVIDCSFSSAKYRPPSVNILTYNGVRSMVAMGASESAVLGLSFDVLVWGTRAHEIIETARLVVSNMFE
jgi:hypothetical protein